MLVAQGDDADYVTPLSELLDWGAWIVVAICGFSVLVVAGRIAMSYRSGEGGRELAGLAWIAAACLLVGSSTAVVAELLPSQ